MRYGQGSVKSLLVVVFILVCLTVFMMINLTGGSDSTAAELVSGAYTDDDSLNYGIVFDCGSSGTRVYIYYWPPHSGDSHELLDIDQLKGTDGKPLSRKVFPGLSTYNTNASNAAEYLKPLLQFAADIIPSQKHSETPLYILATAGMRLISKQSVKEILDDISKDIPQWFSFNFDSSHVEVIPGKVEGMYAWISLNYMLGRFPHGSGTTSGVARKTRQSTAGVIDMGGGSLQIAFEVDKSKLKNKDKLVTFSLGNKDNDPFHTYSLYVTTFLGFGANSAMARYKESLARRNVSTIKDNCQARDAQEDFEYKGVQYSLEGTGDMTACMSEIKPLLNQTTKCKVKPCSLNGVYQPSIPSTSQFYGISEYWYSMFDVLGVQGPYNYNNLLKQAQAYCSTPWAESMKKFKEKKYPHADMERMRVECFKVSWIMTVFHEGLHFPKDFKNFLPVNEIDGEEVQWSLGALVHRTRHLAIEQSHRSLYISERSGVTSLIHAILPYALLLCFVIVIAAIIVYCKNLNKMIKLPSLKTIPSRPTITTRVGRMEQGLTDLNYSYP